MVCMIEEIIYMPPLTARLPCLVTAMMLAIARVFLSSVFVLRLDSIWSQKIIPSDGIKGQVPDTIFIVIMS